MRRFAKLFIILAVIFVIIYAAVGYRLEKRNTINAGESLVVKDTVSVGTGEYGYITDVYKRIGADVKEGEALFSYTPIDNVVSNNITLTNSQSFNPPTAKLLIHNNPDSLLAQTEEESLNKVVLSPVSGILNSIFLPKGSYVTRDDKVVEVQLDSFLIRSKIYIKPEDFDILKVDTPVFIKLPNGKEVDGYISYIHPEYDYEKQEITVDSTITEPVGKLYDGIPVLVKIKKNDSTYSTYQSIKDNIVNFVSQYSPF